MPRLTVVYGAQKHEDLIVDSLKVSDVRTQLGRTFGISSDAVPYIDGERAEESSYVGEGASLEFKKLTGDKG